MKEKAGVKVGFSRMWAFFLPLLPFYFSIIRVWLEYCFRMQRHFQHFVFHFSFERKQNKLLLIEGLLRES